MNKCRLSLTLTLLSLFLQYSYSQTTLYLSTSGGSFTSEKWVEITTLPNGAGLQIWGQGDGSYGNSPGLLNDATFVINCGTTYYINAYDKYDDSWDGTTYEIWTGPGKTGLLVANNGGLSPDDNNDDDASSAFGDSQADELEVSEGFSTVCPCNAPAALFSIQEDCNNAQFFVDVQLTNTGDATAVNIMNGTTTYFSNVGPGNYLIGPFAYSSAVTIEVDGTAYSGCLLSSNSLSEDCQCTTPPSATTNTTNLDCATATYDIQVSIGSFGNGTAADILIDGINVQSNANLGQNYVFSGYSTGNHAVQINASGLGFVDCNQSYLVNESCNGTDTWSLSAPDITNNCSSGDLSVASIDGPTDFGPFCWAGGVSGFGLNFLRPCNSGFDNTTDYTDIWYQVDLPDGSDQMTLELTGLGSNEYIAYTLHTSGPLASSDDFMVNATADQECSFFSQTVTSHTISGLTAFSTAPIYIRIMSASPNQNLACGAYVHPSFSICATAPQANDACNDAIDITINNGGSISNGNLADASDEGINCLGGVTGKDLWYNISNILSSDPNYNGPYQVQFNANGQTGERMIVQLINGCYTCGSITVLATDTLQFASPDSTNFGGFVLSGGISDYKIRLVEYGTTNSFSAAAKLMVVNDECDYFNAPVTAFRLWDGSTAINRNVDMNFANNNDLYYNFNSLSAIPSYSGSVNFSVNGLAANQSVEIEVYERNPLYSTDCTNLSLVGSSISINNDGIYNYDCLNQFEGAYLVRVVDKGSSPAVFTLSATPNPPVPINDDCSTIWDGNNITFEGNAFNITGTTITSDFSNARQCNSINALCGGLDLTASKDLWYVFEIPNSNCPDISASTTISDIDITYDASNAFRDAYIYVYEDCNASTLIDCSGSLDGAGESYRVSGLQAGQTYLLRIKPSSLNSNNNFSFDLSTSLGPVRPCNDRSENAHSLGSILQSGMDRTTCLNGPFSAQGASSSSNPASGTDVWLSFVAPNPANGQSYQIPESYLTIYLQSLSGTGNPYPLSLRVYDEVGLNNSVGVPLGETSVGSGSSTISTNTNGDAWLSLGHLTPGETYFIRISHNQAVGEEVLYNLCMYESPAQNPCDQSAIAVADGVECNNDCSKYYKIQIPDNTPSAYYRFEAIGNNGTEVNLRMFYQANETLGTNNGSITDVDQACGVQSLVPKEGQGPLSDPGTCNGGSGNYGVFNLIGAALGSANLYYLEVYDENNLLGCGGVDICQINILGPYSSLALAQANGTPDITCVNTLPVQLLSFEAQSNENSNKISWSSSQEIDLLAYDLQRSKDGIEFESIHRVMSLQNNYEQQQYQFEDYQFYPLSYYRLVQEDMDGTEAYSNIIALERNYSNTTVIRPNPFKNQMEILSMPDGDKRIVVRNSLGATVLSFRSLNKALLIDTKDLVSGAYSISIYMENATISRKIIKE